MPKYTAVLLMGFLAPATALAGDFCDSLKSIAAQAPSFAALEGGKFNEADFTGTISLPDTTQCVVRHNYEINWNDGSIGPDHIAYECLWNDKTPADLSALHRKVAACYPDARYTDGAEYGTGGTYRLGSLSIAVVLSEYDQLWATIRGE